MRFLAWFYFLCLFAFSGNAQPHEPTLENILKHPELLRIAEKPAHQVQIIYTQIDRDANQSPTFRSQAFGVDDRLYFYPASTVKMPVAFLALQRLRELGIDANTTLKIESDRPVQTSVFTDSTAQNGLPSIAHYIKKVFLVSDNDAYNRLYEFLGQRYINKQLKEKGFTKTRIKHRLVGGYDGVENEYINPFLFYEGGQNIYRRLGVHAPYQFEQLDKDKTVRGVGYWDDNLEQVIDQPFDFSQKNYISLQDLHNMMITIMFPESLPENNQFDLAEEDYQFLWDTMSRLPNESDWPQYDYPDNYVKFFMFGDQREDYEIPPHIKIFNKVGFAYGFVTDVAYIIDTKNKVEFILAAQLLVNENDVFNDGEYEYEEVAFPFLATLGRQVYYHELFRKKNTEPDLSKFKTE